MIRAMLLLFALLVPFTASAEWTLPADTTDQITAGDGTTAWAVLRKPGLVWSSTDTAEVTAVVDVRACIGGFRFTPMEVSGTMVADAEQCERKPNGTMVCEKVVTGFDASNPVSLALSATMNFFRAELTTCSTCEALLVLTCDTLSAE